MAILSAFPHKVRAFLIVEILVALSISLFLSTVFLNLFMNNRTFYEGSNSYNSLQDDLRFLQYRLSALARQTGYRADSYGTWALPSMSTLYPSSAPYLAGTAAKTALDNDTLTLRFQGTVDNLVLDCANRSVDNTLISTNTFSINANQQLTCMTSNTSAPVVLANNIEVFRTLYGEDLFGDGTAARYVPIDYPGLNVARIVSIRFGLLVRSPAASDSLKKEAKTYLILNTPYTAAADGALREVLTFTVQLRNIPLYAA